MTKKQVPTPEMLNNLLTYDPEAGTLTWKRRTKDVHDNDRGRRMFNTKFAGKQAFTSTTDKGYKQGSIFNRNHKAHCVIWAMHQGWAKYGVLHDNGNPLDNRLANLSDGTHAENMKNLKMPSTNTSGVVGVGWHRAARKWDANIKVGGSKIHLGLFTDKADAIAARQAAEVEHGYHPNHGRAA